MVDTKSIWVDEIDPETGKPTGKQTRKRVPVVAADRSVVSTNPRDHNLNGRQFRQFAHFHGYHKAIDAVLAAGEALPLGSPERFEFSKIVGDIERAKVFHFAKVWALIKSPFFKAHIPANVDVTEAKLSERWLLAKDY